MPKVMQIPSVSLYTPMSHTEQESMFNFPELVPALTSPAITHPSSYRLAPIWLAGLHKFGLVCFQWETYIARATGYDDILRLLFVARRGKRFIHENWKALDYVCFAYESNDAHTAQVRRDSTNVLSSSAKCRFHVARNTRNIPRTQT